MRVEAKAGKSEGWKFSRNERYVLWHLASDESCTYWVIDVLLAVYCGLYSGGVSSLRRVSLCVTGTGAGVHPGEVNDGQQEELHYCQDSCSDSRVLPVGH